MGCNIMRPKYIGKHVLLWTLMPYSVKLYENGTEYNSCDTIYPL